MSKKKDYTSPVLWICESVSADIVMSNFGGSPVGPAENRSILEDLTYVELYGEER